MESLAWEMFDWMNDCMARSSVFGRVGKYGLGGVGLGNGRFDEGWNDEINGFWEGCQIQET